ncbi:hypothetical protein ACVD54_001912 [Enterobacter mori]|uniref:hypothetical protein n=1 Tax=Enterobacter mori TaxID=539813 RepID=UPI0028A92D76|nr:hypothetical protein [Enterobacter mori]HED2469144.1 hypothetical protein [Enterobacter mori]
MQQYLPLLLRVSMAPMGFVLIGILAVNSLDFNSYAWGGYQQTYAQLLLALCINLFLASLILIACYLFFLKIAGLWDRKEIYVGIFYICVFQLFYVVFTMTDCDVALKSAVEHLLHLCGRWEWAESLDFDKQEAQRENRDAWITLIYLAGNTSLSQVSTMIFSRRM